MRELLTIGAFARASRLTPKALRLYDELGLLRPVEVDPVNGYRRYHPDQLERARLVAWLRRLGMPLARIRTVCELSGERAAAEIADYWRDVEAETTARRELADFLIDHLSRKDTAMIDAFTVTAAALTDRGLVRPANQDTAYAGARLLAVADGFGGLGADASSAAVEALRSVESALPVVDLLGTVEDAVVRAGSAVRELLAGQESGTTLTALLLSGRQLGLVHVGDSRVYLLRDGNLSQITHDHTVVQSMVDEGTITAEEAPAHPQRALLSQALTGSGEPEPELALRDGVAGDRYLVCSDGLYGVVGEDAIRAVLADGAPADAARRLVAMANDAGGPDNVSCVVADLAA
jgi:PPM family protein phosphatase